MKTMNSNNINEKRNNVFKTLESESEPPVSASKNLVQKMGLVPANVLTYIMDLCKKDNTDGVNLPGGKTALSKHLGETFFSINSAIHDFVDSDLLRLTKRGMPSTVYYRPQWENINELLNSDSQELQKLQEELQELQKLQEEFDLNRIRRTTLYEHWMRHKNKENRNDVFKTLESKPSFVYNTLVLDLDMFGAEVLCHIMDLCKKDNTDEAFVRAQGAALTEYFSYTSSDLQSTIDELVKLDVLRKTKDGMPSNFYYAPQWENIKKMIKRNTEFIRDL